MLKKALASGIAVVAIVGLVTAPASARHKKMHYKHGQTTGMSNGGPTVSRGRGGEGPSGNAGGATSGSSAGAGGSAAGAGVSGATGK
jgi:hypothetical protein